MKKISVHGVVLLSSLCLPISFVFADAPNIAEAPPTTTADNSDVPPTTTSSGAPPTTSSSIDANQNDNGSILSTVQTEYGTLTLNNMDTGNSAIFLNNKKIFEPDSGFKNFEYFLFEGVAHFKDCDMVIVHSKLKNGPSFYGVMRLNPNSTITISEPAPIVNLEPKIMKTEHQVIFNFGSNAQGELYVYRFDGSDPNVTLIKDSVAAPEQVKENDDNSISQSIKTKYGLLNTKNNKDGLFMNNKLISNEGLVGTFNKVFHLKNSELILNSMSQGHSGSIYRWVLINSDLSVKTISIDDKYSGDFERSTQNGDEVEIYLKSDLIKGGEDIIIYRDGKTSIREIRNENAIKMAKDQDCAEQYNEKYIYILKNYPPKVCQDIDSWPASSVNYNNYVRNGSKSLINYQKVMRASCITKHPVSFDVFRSMVCYAK